MSARPHRRTLIALFARGLFEPLEYIAEGRFGRRARHDAAQKGFTCSDEFLTRAQAIVAAGCLP